MFSLYLRRKVTNFPRDTQHFHVNFLIQGFGKRFRFQDVIFN